MTLMDGVLFASPFVALLTIFATKLSSLVKEARQLRQAIARHIRVVGVIGDIPEALVHLPVYSRMKDIIQCAGDKCVVMFSKGKLSYALQECDFVCCDAEDDPKIHPPESNFWKAFMEE